MLERGVVMEIRIGREYDAYFSVKVRCSSQVMMGRFWRSLKVGRITE